MDNDGGKELEIVKVAHMVPDRHQISFNPSWPYSLQSYSIMVGLMANKPAVRANFSCGIFFPANACFVVHMKHPRKNCTLTRYVDMFFVDSCWTRAERWPYLDSLQAHSYSDQVDSESRMSIEIS